MEKRNKQEETLLKLREEYGAEAESAMRDYLNMIGDEFYLWLADLYLPRNCNCDNFDGEGNRICLLPRDENGKCTCTGGGFYYCNSARDTDGYEIDIESTVQAIRFLDQCGLLDDYNGDYKAALPKQMQKDVCAFAKSLQDPVDGYFYHPQWGKDIIPSRQGRDLGWATGILKDLGDMPLYDTPNGHKGSLGAPLGLLGNSEKGSAVWSPRLLTLDAFKEYLASKDVKNKSYPVGNEVFSQSAQIIARDKQMWLEQNPDADPDSYDKQKPAKGGFIEALRDYFFSNRNPENGLWQDETCYYSVNGLMKISGGYNSVGFKLDYAEAAFDSAIKMTLLPVGEPDCKGKTTTGSVDVYNPWFAMSALLGNVKKFGTEEEYANLKAMLKKNAAALIRVTGEKAKKFKKEDGSFGYTWGAPPAASQMAPVCPPGIIEGDINGGTIATVGILCSMCGALGIGVPIYSGDGLEKFNDRIKKNCGYK